MLAAPKYLLVLKYIEAKQRNGIINSVNTKYLITEQVWLIWGVAPDWTAHHARHAARHRHPRHGGRPRHKQQHHGRVHPHGQAGADLLAMYDIIRLLFLISLL